MLKDDKPTIYEHEGEQIKPCMSCRALIFFKKMPSGKFLPVNAGGEKGGWTHFATCPAASKHRRKRGGKS